MPTGTSTDRTHGAQPRTVLTRPGTRRLVDALVPALLLLALVLLTLDVVRGGVTLRLDHLVLGATPGEGNGPALPGLLALLVVDVATPAVAVAALLVLATGLAVWARRPGPLVLAGAAVVLLTGTVLAGKDLIPRAAPGYEGVLGAGGAFPSGHTTTTLVCAGVAAALVARARPTLRRAAWVAVAAWTALVAASLLWLHFHWLSDVVGALLLGSLILWLLLRWPWRLGAPKDGRPDRGGGRGWG